MAGSWRTFSAVVCAREDDGGEGGVEGSTGQRPEARDDLPGAGHRPRIPPAKLHSVHRLPQRSVDLGELYYSLNQSDRPELSSDGRRRAAANCSVQERTRCWRRACLRRRTWRGWPRRTSASTRRWAAAGGRRPVHLLRPRRPARRVRRAAAAARPPDHRRGSCLAARLLRRRRRAVRALQREAGEAGVLAEEVHLWRLLPRLVRLKIKWKRRVRGCCDSSCTEFWCVNKPS